MMHVNDRIAKAIQTHVAKDRRKAHVLERPQLERRGIVGNPQPLPSDVKGGLSQALLAAERRPDCAQPKSSRPDKPNEVWSFSPCILRLC